MEAVLKMAGQLASHAVNCVSSGDILMPIVGYTNTDGTRKEHVFAMGSVEAMRIGQEKFEQSLNDDTLGATFIKDGFTTLATGKTDALIIDVGFSDSVEKKIQFLVPYRNANHESGFAVHRLQVSGLEGIAHDEVETLTNHFFDGLEEDKLGWKTWNESYVDQAGVSTGFAGAESTNFSGEDFEVLKHAPFLIFFLVAAADGQVDKKEVITFAKLLSDSDKINNPLMVRIITNVINDVQTRLADMATRKLDYIQELSKLGQIIDRYLSETDAKEFKLALLSIAVEIAGASGGVLGFGSKISKEEKQAIAGIAVCLNLGPVS